MGWGIGKGTPVAFWRLLMGEGRASLGTGRADRITCKILINLQAQLFLI